MCERDTPTEADWFEGWVGLDGSAPLFDTADTESRGRTLMDLALVALGFVVVQIVLVGTVLGGAEALGVTEESTPVAFYGLQTALGLGSFIIVGVAYLYWRQDRSLVGIRLPTRRDGLVMIVGFVLMVALMLGAGVVMDALGIEVAENEVITQGSENPELFLLLIPLQFLLTGPGEELLFRGVIQGLIRRSYGVVPGILGASVLFTLVHIQPGSGGGELAMLAVVFCSGVLLGALYEYSGSLLVPVLVHASWNAVVFGSEYVEAAGTVFG